MVAKISASRQTCFGLGQMSLRLHGLASAIVKGVLRLDTQVLLIGLWLVRCSGPEVTQPLPDTSGKECEAIATFLASDAARASDLLQVRDRAGKILAQNRSISMQNCPSYATLERLFRQISARFPSDPAWQTEYAASEKMTQELAKKNESFRWQLPGDKRPGTRATFLKRLATTSDRSKRQSLYKLFNSSRSRRWISWGFKDLVMQRNREAKAAGSSSYMEYMYRRQGLNFAQSMEVLDSIKSRLGPVARRKLNTLAQQNGITALEPWDIYFLMDSSFGNSLQKNIQPSLVADYVRGWMNSLDLKEVDPQAIAIDAPIVKTDFGAVAGQTALAIYAKSIKQPILVFQHASESAKEAVFEAIRFMALDSPLLAPTLQKQLGNLSVTELAGIKPLGYASFAWSAYRYAWLFEFEKRMYEEPQADFLELWSQVSQEFWGIEVPVFYGGFDQDEYLTAPTAVAEKAVGAFAAVGMVEGAYRQFSQNVGPGFGASLKRDWFASGSENLTLDMLPQISKTNWTIKTLTDLLVSSLEL